MSYSAQIVAGFSGETAVVSADTADELIVQIGIATGIPPTAQTLLLCDTGPALDKSKSTSKSTEQTVANAAELRWIPFNFQSFQSECQRSAAIPSPALDAFISSILPMSDTTSTSGTQVSASSLLPHASEMPVLLCFDRRFFASTLKTLPKSLSTEETSEGGNVAGIHPLQPEELHIPGPSDVNPHDDDEEERALMSAFLFLSSPGISIDADTPITTIVSRLPSHIQAVRSGRKHVQDALEAANALLDGAAERMQSIRIASVQVQRQILSAHAARSQTIISCTEMHQEVSAQLASSVSQFKDAAATAALAPMVVEELRRIPLHPQHVAALRSEFSDAKSLFDVLPHASIAVLTDRIPACIKKSKATLHTLASQVEAVAHRLTAVSSMVPSKANSSDGSPPDPSQPVDVAFVFSVIAKAASMLSEQQSSCHAVQQAYQAYNSYFKQLITNAAGASLDYAALEKEVDSRIEAMKAVDAQLRRLQGEMHACLVHNARMLSVHLQLLSSVQSDMKQLHDARDATRAELTLLHTFISEITNLQYMPRAYNALIVETSRRVAFKRSYQQTVANFQKQLRDMWEHERSFREKFGSRHGRQLPACLLRGINALPPRVNVKIGVQHVSVDGSRQTESSMQSEDMEDFRGFDKELPEIVHATLVTPSRWQLSMRADTSALDAAPLVSPTHTSGGLGHRSPVRSATSPSKFSKATTTDARSADCEKLALRIAELEAEIASVLAVARVPRELLQRHNSPAYVLTMTKDAECKTAAEDTETHATPQTEMEPTKEWAAIIEMCKDALTHSSGTFPSPGKPQPAAITPSVVQQLGKPISHLKTQAVEMCEKAIAGLQSRSAELQRTMEAQTRAYQSDAVSIREFQTGCNALFLPVGRLDENGVRIYLAFNVGAPHHYLDPECAVQMKQKGRWPDFVVGEITNITSQLVPPEAAASHTASTSSPSASLPAGIPTGKSPGTPPSAPLAHPDALRRSPSQAKSTTGISPGFPRAISGEHPERLSLAPSAHTHAESSASIPADVSHTSKNPFHLHPGTKYHLITVKARHTAP